MYELIRRGFRIGPKAEQSLKRRHWLPIVAKEEFIEVDLELSRAHAVMGAEQPLLQVTDCLENAVRVVRLKSRMTAMRARPVARPRCSTVTRTSTALSPLS
jgi:hypothetical protein